MKLTITLTLKGREEFTYRWMKYMNEMHCPYKILIADGGDNFELEAHLRRLDNYPNLDYEYIRYPFDTNLDMFFSKLENVISRVKTDYILQADNDDFYLLHSIPELIEFLDCNPDYVAARGQLVNFEVYDENANTKMQVKGCSYYASLELSPSPSLDSDYYLTRIEKMCQGMSDYNYYMNWYSIIRARTLKEIWRDLITLPIKEVIVLEILCHVMLINAGKLKIKSTPFYLRQADTSIFGDNLVLGNQFLERCISNNSFSEFSTAVERFMGINSIEDKREVLRSIAGWLNIFIFNIHTANLVRAGRRYRFTSLIKKIPFFVSYGRCFISLIRRFVWRTPARIRLRITEIEPFVIIHK